MVVYLETPFLRFWRTVPDLTAGEAWRLWRTPRLVQS